jgi:hypothetical protein
MGKNQCANNPDKLTQDNAIMDIRLSIGVEKLHRLPSASVLLDSDPSGRSDEETSLYRCYLS